MTHAPSAPAKKDQPKRSAPICRGWEGGGNTEVSGATRRLRARTGEERRAAMRRSSYKVSQRAAQTS